MSGCARWIEMYLVRSCSPVCIVIVPLSPKHELSHLSPYANGILCEENQNNDLDINYNNNNNNNNNDGDNKRWFERIINNSMVVIKNRHSIILEQCAELIRVTLLIVFVVGIVGFASFFCFVVVCCLLALLLVVVHVNLYFLRGQRDQ